MIIYRAFHNVLLITNVYNKKTKGPTLMELFTATEKLKKLFLTTKDVRCVHHGWHGTHPYDIQVLATGDTAHIHMIFKFLPLVTRHTSIRYSSSCHTHASTWVQWYSSLLQWSVPLGQRGHVGGSFAYFAYNACCTVTTDLLMWYSNTQNDFSPGAAIFSLRTLASPSGRNVNYDENQHTGKKIFELFLLSVQVL